MKIAVTAFRKTPDPRAPRPVQYAGAGGRPAEPEAGADLAMCRGKGTRSPCRGRRGAAARMGTMRSTLCQRRLLSRRNALRGLGAAAALPLLDAMRPLHAAPSDAAA